MPLGDKWDKSSSGHQMFIKFVADLYNYGPGFLAFFHFGTKQYCLLPFLKICIRLNLFSANCMSVTNGNLGFCSCQSCSENEGDCDSNNECLDGLVCGLNNCPASLGHDSEVDCCYEAIVGTEDFCSYSEPCETDEGDCDSDDECEFDLSCGSNNCPTSLGFGSEVNCCFPCPDTCGSPSYKDDQYCDDENNNCGCEWDGGDCCGINVNTKYCSACECLDPNTN